MALCGQDRLGDGEAGLSRDQGRLPPGGEPGGWQGRESMARACLRSRQAAAEGLGRRRGDWKNVQRGRKQSYGDMEREWFTLLNAATRSRTRRPGRWPWEPWNSGWSRTCREAVGRARAWLGVLKGGRDRGGKGRKRGLSRRSWVP